MRRNRRFSFAGHLIAVAVSLGILSGCQSMVSSSAQPELPPIISKTIKDGKGQPYGRSDADSRYIKTSVKVSSNPAYGYSQINAIGVPVRDHRLYLNTLRGPEGQPIEYERLGACCYGPDHPAAKGPVDIYRIRVDGVSKEIFLFLDGYKEWTTELPMGFQQRK
jgi:hypothetical protein